MYMRLRKKVIAEQIKIVYTEYYNRVVIRDIYGSILYTNWIYSDISIAGKVTILNAYLLS